MKAITKAAEKSKRHAFSNVRIIVPGFHQCQKSWAVEPRFLLYRFSLPLRLGYGHSLFRKWPQFWQLDRDGSLQLGAARISSQLQRWAKRMSATTRPPRRDALPKLKHFVLKKLSVRAEIVVVRVFTRLFSARVRTNYLLWSRTFEDYSGVLFSSPI